MRTDFLIDDHNNNSDNLLSHTSFATKNNDNNFNFCDNKKTRTSTTCMMITLF